jgi:hypothetical protein
MLQSSDKRPEKFWVILADRRFHQRHGSFMTPAFFVRIAEDTQDVGAESTVPELTGEKVQGAVEGQPSQRTELTQGVPLRLPVLVVIRDGADGPDASQDVFEDRRRIGPGHHKSVRSIWDVHARLWLVCAVLVTPRAFPPKENGFMY